MASGSIVDFLNTQGKPSTFKARGELFVSGGLDKRLGDFTGSASQNTALLNSLQKSANATPDVGVDFLTSQQRAGVQTAQATVDAAQKPAPATPDIAAPPSEVSGEQDFGRFDLTQVPQIQPISASEILSRARGETGVQIAEQEKDIKKQAIQQALPQNLANVKADFASRGLVFSGARSVAEQATRDQALADKLDVDIRFAKILGNAIDRAANELGQEMEDIIKAAQENRKEEVAFLKSVGLAVDPATGELFPTLEAQRLQNQITGNQFDDAIAIAKFNFDQIKEQANLAETEFDQAATLIRLDQAERGIIIREREALESKRSSAVLSLTDLKELGLPFSLLGANKQEIGESIQQAAPPEWFRTQQEQLQQQSIPLGSPELLTKWQNFQAGTAVAVGERQFLNEGFFEQAFKMKIKDAAVAMVQVEAFRLAGFTDDEILTMMQ